MDSRPALHLRLLGTLELRGEDDSQLSSVAEHSKQTALLLYLALASPPAPQRRDTLQALLWPELSQDRARIALNKAVHFLRRALPRDLLVRANDGGVGISSERISIDVSLFEDAVRAQRHLEALRLYRGDLLPGFFVDDAAAFMAWLDDRRLALRRLASHSALVLAADLGDPDRALASARRARELDPIDERAVRAAMAALDRMGDRAAALREYQEFAAMLRREYDTEPSPETTSVVRRIRGRTTPAPAPLETRRLEPQDPPAMPAPSPQRRSPRRARIASVGVLASIVLLSSYAIASVRRVDSTVTESGTTLIVMPFHVRGISDNGYLGDGVTTLLAEQLNGVGALRSVSPRLIYGAIETLPPGADRDSTLARRFGAALVVKGDVLEERGRLHVSAELVDRSRGEELARASAEGETTHVFDLVARVAATLSTQAGLARGQPNVELTGATQSPGALRAYLDGQRAYRMGSFSAAVQAYQRAVEADSMFALAHWRLASAASWAGEIRLVHPSLDRAERLASKLPAPIQRHVRALQFYLRGEYDEALPIWREIARRDPADADAWSSIADVLFHYGAPMGMPMSESLESLRKVIALEPGNAGALLHLLLLAARDGDRAAFERYATQLQAQNLDAARRVEIRALRAFTFGDSAARVAVRPDLPLLNDELLSSIYQHVAPTSSDLALLDVVFTTESAARPNQWIGWQLRNTVGIAAGRGQVGVMRLKLDSLLAADRSLGLLQEAAVTSLPFMRLRDRRADALLDALAASEFPTSPPPLTFGRVSALRAYFTGMLALHFDATARAESAARRLSAMRIGRSDVAVASGLLTLLRAEILAHDGRPREAIAALGPPRRAPVYADDYPAARERMLRAELAEAVGDVAAAHRWYATFPREGVGDLPHLAWAYYRDGLLYERQGDVDAARSRFARALRIMRDADTVAIPFAAELRRRHQR